MKIVLRTMFAVLVALKLTGLISTGWFFVCLPLIIDLVIFSAVKFTKLSIKAGKPWAVNLKKWSEQE